MALNKLTVNVDKLGIGRVLPEEDHVSGMIFYHATLPSGFGSSDRVKRIQSVPEAEDLGILNDRSDETKATGGQFTITAAGAADDVWTAVITPAGQTAITLGAYTEVSGDGVNDIATGLRAAINALTNTHGFIAAGTTDIVSLTAGLGYGDGINTSGLALTSSGSGTNTPVQFSGGVDAFHDVMHYHISEYFRMQPKGDLYVGIYVSSTVDLSKIETVQTFSLGKIRQIAVYDHNTAFASSQITTLQTSATTLDTNESRLSVLYAADFSGIALSALPNLKTLASKKVSVVIGEDGSGSGKTLADDRAYSITNLGSALGAASLAKVSENIGWVEKFNLVTGTEMLTPQFAEGTKFQDITVTLETQLHDFGYIYSKTHNWIAGTYFNDSSTATAGTSDFSNLEANRQIDKAVREIRKALLPKLNGPLFVDSLGKISQTTVEVFKADAQKEVDDMVIAEELSAAQIIINPDQDVLATSQIVVAAELVPVGAARSIVLNIGFVAKLTDIQN